MTSRKHRILVFVDTSYIRQKAKGQSAEWHRLLLLAKNREIEIHVSHIAIEEYRSQCVDHLYAKIEKSKNSLRDLKKEWLSNPIAEHLGEAMDYDIFPDIESLEDEANKMKASLINDHHITVRMPSESQGERVWRDYFSWQSIFRFVRPTNRDDRSTRDSRRKNIPDAWIYECAVDLSKENSDIVCLCGDQKLSELLNEQGIEVCVSIDEVEQILGTDDNESATGDKETVVGETDSQTHETSPLRQRLLSIDQSEKDLQLRILGYTHMFTPIAKGDLIRFLEEQGHTETELDVAARRLIMNGLIKDSGSHYISIDRVLGKEAATEIMEEIVEKL